MATTVVFYIVYQNNWTLDSIKLMSKVLDVQTSDLVSFVRWDLSKYEIRITYYQLNDVIDNHVQEAFVSLQKFAIFHDGIPILSWRVEKTV